MLNVLGKDILLHAARIVTITCGSLLYFFFYLYSLFSITGIVPVSGPIFCSCRLLVVVNASVYPYLLKQSSYHLVTTYMYLLFTINHLLFMF